MYSEPEQATELNVVKTKQYNKSTQLCDAY